MGDNEPMQVLDRTMRIFLIAAGLLQGFLLLLLHEIRLY